MLWKTSLETGSALRMRSSRLVVERVVRALLGIRQRRRGADAEALRVPLARGRLGDRVRVVGLNSTTTTASCCVHRGVVRKNSKRSCVASASHGGVVLKISKRSCTTSVPRGVPAAARCAYTNSFVSLCVRVSTRRTSSRHRRAEERARGLPTASTPPARTHHCATTTRATGRRQPPRGLSQNGYGLAKTRPVPTQVQPGRSRREDKAVPHNRPKSEPCWWCSGRTAGVPSRSAHSPSRSAHSPPRGVRPPPRRARASSRAQGPGKTSVRGETEQGHKDRKSEGKPSSGPQGHEGARERKATLFPCVTNIALY